MDRVIKFKTLIEYPAISACIYRIWFGSFYYIGATRNFSKRISAHRCLLNNALKGYCPEGTYSKIVLHLRKNDHIDEAVVEIIKTCLPEDIYELEREYHLAALGDKRCLNVFYHHRTRIKALSVPLPGAK